MRALTIVYSGHDSDTATQEALMERLQPVMPFLKDFVVTAATPDVDERRFAMPELLSPRMYVTHAAQSLPRRKMFKNVMMLPDSSRFMLETARNARLVASRLI